MKPHAPTQLGEKQTLTDDGFLLCEDVPLASTKELLYAPNELVRDGKALVQPGTDGVVRIVRSDDELFSDVALRSMQGASFTMGHPSAGVTPETFRNTDAGTVLNPRRGTGEQSHCMMGDILVKDAALIRMIRNRDLREVSAGYLASYQDLGYGRGSQHNIRFNHVAAVPKGRCGTECSIGDQAMTVETDKTEAGLMSKMFDFIVGGGVKPAAAITADAAPVTQADLAAFKTELLASVAAIKTADASPKDQWGELTTDASPEAEARRIVAGKPKPEVKTFDAAATGVALANLKSRAEILTPGIKFTASELTTDAAAHDHVCACQRQALTTAYANTDTRTAITAFTGDAPDFAKMTDAQLEVAFVGASEVMRQRNNAAVASGQPARTNDSMSRVEQIQAEADAHWAKTRVAN